MTGSWVNSGGVARWKLSVVCQPLSEAWFRWFDGRLPRVGAGEFGGALVDGVSGGGVEGFVVGTAEGDVVGAAVGVVGAG